MGDLVALAGAAIPVVAIVMGIGSYMFKEYLNSKERIAGLRVSNDEEVTGDIRQEVAALRTEVNRLRDSSTQFDLSIDHTLKDLQQRVESIERPRSPYVPTISQAAEETLHLKQS